MHRGKTLERKILIDTGNAIRCNIWWLKGEVTFIVYKVSYPKNKKKATSSTKPSVCVCLLPHWCHSFPGYSWSCRGWTSTSRESSQPKSSSNKMLLAFVSQMLFATLISGNDRISGRPRPCPKLIVSCNLGQTHRLYKVWFFLFGNNLTQLISKKQTTRP